VTIFNASQFNSGVIAGNVQARLIALREALHAVADLYGWSSGVSAADLEAIGFSAADAGTLLSAISDANALAQIYATGQPPASYPQAAQAYVYAASQRQVTGPQ
jgi:hypothetical protein